MVRRAEAESLRGRIGRLSDPTNPDTIIQNDLPQLPLEDWDAPIQMILGRCEGPIFDSTHTEVETQSRKKMKIFSSPVQTQFVRVQLEDGSEQMEAYDVDRHGEWEAIPDMGMTPTQLLEELYGFGESEIEQGQQFQRTRKQPGGASRKKWQVGHHPKTRSR